MNPDVLAAIGRLRAEGLLAEGQAAFFGRVARRNLVSVRLEIRVLLYAGVLLLTTGVGLLVKEHQREIGPLTIASAIGLGAALCLFWVIRKGSPFSWGEVASPHVAFDYVLLLGLLLFASDLAYVEVQFTLLGPNWTWHLLVVAAVYLAAAYRWDSRTILGLALTTLVAWRGISIGPRNVSLWLGDVAGLRGNAIVLGALYVAAATLSVRLGKKPHFEAVFANTGLLLLLGALLSGVFFDDSNWGAWLTALLAVTALLLWASYRLGRTAYFAEGVVAAYVGLLRLIFEPVKGPEGGALAFLFAALLGAGALVLIVAAHRQMRDR